MFFYSVPKPNKISISNNYELFIHIYNNYYINTSYSMKIMNIYVCALFT